VQQVTTLTADTAVAVDHKQVATSVENRTLPHSFPNLAKFPAAPQHLNDGLFNNLKLNMRLKDLRHEVKREKNK
jgi:hypothetical protein